MSTLERREVTTTRVVRTLSPQRATSQQNITEFDNNLDHLLEDLQSSVSRPGSSLGNAYHETRTVTYGSGKGDSLGRVQYLQAANPTTVVSDDMYNYKPADNTRSMKTYKTENYSTYSVNSEVPENVRIQNNINKLDTLLDDLQQVRQGTLDKDSSHREVKRTVHRELVYDDKSTDRRQDREGSVPREIEYINDGTYGDIRQIRQSSPTRSNVSTNVREYNYTTDTTSVSPPTEIVTVEPAINPAILAQLDPNLLPSPNTKVTTTIKTYTYEIPGSGYPSAVSPKLSDTVYSSNPSTPSRSFAYNKVENTSTQNLTTNYPGDYIRPVSPSPIEFNKKFIETTTTRNVTDGYGKPSPTPVRPGKDTYIYNETTKNVNNTTDYPSEYPPSPPGKQINIYKETTTTRNINQPPHGNYPNNGYPNNNYPQGPGPVNKTYIINETHTTRNVNNPPYPPNGYPTHPDPSHTTIIYKHDTQTSNNYPPTSNTYPPKNVTETFDPKSGPPPHNYPKPHDPREPMNITYKYTTHHTTSNNYKGHPNDENEPLLHPPPFPTDGSDVDGKGPPKRLDELMAEFGNEPPNNAYNAGYNARQAELAHKKDNTQVSTETQKKELKDMPKSKNVAGPPVYYPPNHEMFARKEESGGYRAEGGMMKESGKYKYEASSSSKTKSSSGVAVVPVCLPLCCGLPCAIL